MMKLTKEEKETILLTSEADDMWSVYTFSTDLKKRLAAFSKEHPEECQIKDIDKETGSVTYLVRKGRLSIHLNAPYSAERRKAISERAKSHGVHMQEGRM